MNADGLNCRPCLRVAGLEIAPAILQTETAQLMILKQIFDTRCHSVVQCGDGIAAFIVTGVVNCDNDKPYVFLLMFGLMPAGKAVSLLL